MNQCLPRFVAVLAIASTVGGAFAASDNRHELEPCINGAVSATGLFASQAKEDRYLAAHADQDAGASRLAAD